MDLQTVTDLSTLKSLAYDQIKILDQTQENLRLLNVRINELEAANKTAETESLKKPAIDK